MTDLIKREHIIKVLEDAKRSAYEHWDIDTGNAFEEVINLVKNIPAIEAEPEKHGRWQPFDRTWGRNIYACTSCGQAFEVPTEDGKPIYDYCPKCGARMDEVKE